MNLDGAAAAVAKLQEKGQAHPHHDYLSFAIPSTWFLVGALFVDAYFYRFAHANRVTGVLAQPFANIGPLSNVAEFFAGLATFLVAFGAIYVIGQLLNGMSALLLDRMVVKKLLKYPFQLYAAALAPDGAALDDHRLFKREVMKSSYAVMCLNLPPFFVLEGAAAVALYNHGIAPLDSAGLSPFALTILTVTPVLCYFHLGWPRVLALHEGTEDRSDGATDEASAADDSRREAAQDKSKSVARGRTAAFTCHRILLGVTASAAMAAVVSSRWWVVALGVLPLTNVALIAADKITRKRLGNKYLGSSSAAFFDYFSCVLPKPIYSCAIIVGYHSLPSRKLLGRVKARLGEDAVENEFFWTSYLIVQNHPGGMLQTTYHFLASYGMVRNLCCSTLFVFLYTCGRFAIQYPNDGRGAVLWWLLSLLALAFSLLARYLYMYASYFSKYVLRAAAVALNVHFPRPDHAKETGAMMTRTDSGSVQEVVTN